MEKLKLKDTKKSYIVVVIFGFVVGIITELVNLLPNNDLWGLSSIAGAFGFWIFSTTIIIYLSSSNKNAMINAFLYLTNMCIGYYLLQGIIDLINPTITVDKIFQWDHLFYWIGISILCGIVAYILYFWNNDKKIYSSFLYALPVAGMFSDTVNNCLKFHYSHTQLLQTILDIVFLTILFILFFKKSNKKVIYIATIVLVAFVGYFTVFPKSYNLTTEASITCELEGIEEKFYIKIREDGKIIEKKGNEEIYNEIDIQSFKTAPEVIRALQDYYESKGGSWNMK